MSGDKDRRDSSSSSVTLPDDDMPNLEFASLIDSCWKAIAQAERDEKDIEARIQATESAWKAKQWDVTVIDGADEDDLPDDENVLEYFDKGLSAKDLEKKIKKLELVLQDIRQQKIDLPNRIKELREAKLQKEREFKQQIEQLPIELKRLSVLYEVGDYTNLNHYLQQYKQMTPPVDAETYASFLMEVSQVVQDAAREAATKSLEEREGVLLRAARTPPKAFKEFATDSFYNRTVDYVKSLPDNRIVDYVKSWLPGAKSKPETAQDKKIADADEKIVHVPFAQLPDDTRKKLVKLRAFLISMNAFIMTSGLTPGDPEYQELVADYEKIQKHLSNALENHRTQEEALNEGKSIVAKLEKENIIFRVKALKNHLFTKTNAKAAASAYAATAASMGISSMWFGASLDKPKALAIAGIAAVVTGVGFAQDAWDKAKADAAQLTDDDRKLAQSGDYYYFQKMDAIFGVEDKQLPEVHQDVATQIKGAMTGAGKWIPQRVKDLFYALSGGAQQAIKIALALCAVMLVVTVIAAIPGMWPVLLAIAGIVAVGVGAWALGFPVVKVANAVVQGVATIARGITNVISLGLRPIVSLVANIRNGNYKSAAATVGVASLAAIAGVFLAPIVLPALGIAGLIGGAAGAYLGMGALEVLNNTFLKPVRMAMENAQTLSEARRFPELKLNAQQKDVLNVLSPDFAPTVLEHFTSRAEDLRVRIRKTTNMVNPKPELTRQLGKELKVLETQWAKISQVLNNIDWNALKDPSTAKAPTELIEVLKEILRDQYVVERNRYAQGTADTGYKERTRRGMRFGAVESAKMTPVGEKPDFEMNFEVDFERKRANIEKLRDLLKVVNLFEDQYKSPQSKHSQQSR